MSDVTCPGCQSSQIVRNGKRAGKQKYLCRSCQRQFLRQDDYGDSRQYAPEVKQLCLKMHLQKHTKLREIERLTDIHHTTILRWVEEANGNGNFQPSGIIRDSAKLGDRL